MRVDDLPLLVDPPTNFRTIPTNGDLFFSIRAFDSIDKVKGQNGDIALELNQWVNHFVSITII
jgi:hypothetical protein